MSIAWPAQSISMHCIARLRAASKERQNNVFEKVRLCGCK
jgi:hypothetical protein